MVRDAHSLPVETLAELGLVGFTILAAFIGSALWIAIDRLRRARGGERAAIGGLLGALTVYLVGAAVDWMWELTVVTGAGMVIIGLLAGPAAATDTVADLETPEVAWPRRAVVALAAGAVVVAELVVLLAALELGASQADARAGMLPDARAAALGAAKVEPWAATPYLQLALVEEAQGNLWAARKAIDRSLARDPGDWRFWLVKARIENGLATMRVERAAWRAPGRSTPARRLSPGIDAESSSALEHGQHVVGVRRRLDVPHDLRDVPVGADHERRSDDAHVRATVTRLLGPDPVRLGGRVVGIGEQRERKLVVALERARARRRRQRRRGRLPRRPRNSLRRRGSHTPVWCNLTCCPSDRNTVLLSAHERTTA